jgi:hypothetical protein
MMSGKLNDKNDFSLDASDNFMRTPREICIALRIATSESPETNQYIFYGDLCIISLKILSLFIKSDFNNR